MNMFKSRRKARDQSDTLDMLTGGPSPVTYKPTKASKRRNKDAQQEFKLAFDLSSALPDSDEFRTSLLMPNLSARFSMLREQDDPNTKVGKASDDSVLFPKRVSRMNLFTHTPLADVAEVEPPFSPFRPPFAERDRSNSMGDGYDSDGGSIMSRSRPVEGAAQYGSRQKPFRMPPPLARNFTENAKYEPDISLKNFQQFRMKEKELQTAEQLNRMSIPVTDGGDSSDVASPATIFSKKRGTQSSTNSGPQRSSTAATSIASESPILSSRPTDGTSPTPIEGTHHVPETENTVPTVKPRYEAIPNRFASIKKERSRPVPLFASPSYRNATSPTALQNAQPLDFGFNTQSRSNSVTDRSQTDSPSSGTRTENDDVLANNVQPNDRGKATALGLFNKPAREFDEHQFNQRQIQMHEEYLSNSRSTSRASADDQKLRQTSVTSVPNASAPQTDRISIPQAPPVPSNSASPVQPSNRVSRASGHDTPPRPRSKSLASSSTTSNVKARLESLIRKQNAELAALEAEKLGEQESSENKENHINAFDDDEEDDDDEHDASNTNVVNTSRAASSRVEDESHIHPAFRNSYRVSDTQSRKSNHSNFSRTRSVFEDDRSDNLRLQVPSKDHTSVSQENNLGLSGLIRTHLRHDSDTSNMMLRPESSVAPRTSEPSRNGSTASLAITAVDSVRSDPFDLDPNRGQIRISQAPPTPTTAMSQVAQRFLSQAQAIKDAASKENVEDAATTERMSTERSWHDSEPKHQRGESSETTKERREFDEELADRRRKIREGLKSVVERDRSQSPAGTNRGQNVAMQAFVQQRSVTDPQPKALKMLGLQSRHGQPSPLEDERGKTSGFRGDYRGRAPESGFQNRQQTVTYARFGPEPDTGRHYPPRSLTPPASRYGMRERSNSNTDPRSKSRNRQRQPDPPMPVRRADTITANQSSSSPTEDLDVQPGFNDRNVYRGPKSPPHDLLTGMSARASPRPSPISPQNNFDSPAEFSRPLNSPKSNGRTTPSNGRATPTNVYGRKRSVTKTMISEPTFVSSTSSVPLVHLPTAQQNPPTFTPPIPIMNPRRRGNTTGEKPILSPVGAGFSRSTPLEPVPASPLITDFETELNGQGRHSISPRKLRKANSEGGSMAAKARQQAMAAELAKEKARSPALPVFPNRSTTALDNNGDGAMF